MEFLALSLLDDLVLHVLVAPCLKVEMDLVIPVVLLHAVLLRHVQRYRKNTGESEVRVFDVVSVYFLVHIK